MGRSVEKQEQIIAITQANLVQKPRVVEVNTPVIVQKTTTVQKGYPTGYDVWNEANKYRVSQGKPEMILDKRYCNNIAAREQNYRENNSHKGLSDFNKEFINIGRLTEILNWGKTAKEVVDGWASSPSHNLFLLGSTRGCAYSSDGYSVILMD